MIRYSSISELNLDQDDVYKIKSWVEGFLCAPHPSLRSAGRDTAVCPMLAPAVDSDRLLICKLDLGISPDCNKREYLRKEIRQIAKNFIGATDSTEGSLDSLLIAITNLQKHEWRYVLDGARVDVKAYLLNNKLMVGAFYPTSNRPSRVSKTFYPLRSPMPMLGIRHLLRVDWRTLLEDPKYIEIYESFYGEGIVPDQYKTKKKA